MKLVPLLWQAGYLTIESYDSVTKNYQLCFPNEEVRISFFEYVMKTLTEVDPAKISSMVSAQMQALQQTDLEGFFELLKIFFAQIPYELHIPI